MLRTQRCSPQHFLFEQACPSDELDKTIIDSVTSNRARPIDVVHQLADALAEGLAQKAYDRLVIVAAPPALGDLRAALSEHVRTKVTAEVAKDLTKTPDTKLTQHLIDALRA